MHSNGWAELWDDPSGCTYLNTAAHSMLPRTAVEVIQRSIQVTSKPHLAGDYGYFDTATRTRAALAQILGARAEDIALGTGATSGLERLAHAIAWKQGDEVLSCAGEFPIQFATWKPLETRYGILLRMLASKGPYVSTEEIIEAIGPTTRLLSISHVRFDDGAMVNAKAIAEVCRERGVLFALDVSQSCGTLPISVEELGADVVVCAGYKWLLGPSGTGFTWIRPGLFGSLQPGPCYWASQPEQDFTRLEMREPSAALDARRWDSPENVTHFNFNLSAFAASTELVASLDLKEIRTHGQTLIQQLFDTLPKGYTPASPTDSRLRGIFGCFRAESLERTVQAHGTLKQNHIMVSLRGGNIRVSPYLFNSYEDIDLLLRSLPR